MAETSLPWGGIAVGDAGPYTDDQWTDVWRKLLTRDRTLEGVLPDYLNELVVTNPAGATIRVGTGGAVVDGKFYDNSANVDLAGAVPGGGSNFYTVVLDKNFAAQTVRASLLGPNVVAPPAVTQADGVDWEIAIYTVEITSGAVVTLTDVRVYCHYNTEISGAMILDDAITTPKILDGAVTAAKMTDGAGSGVDADLLDGVQGSSYVNTIVQMNAVGDAIPVAGAAAILVPGLTVALAVGTYFITGTIPLDISGVANQYSYVRVYCFLNGVQQGSASNWQLDVPTSNRQQKVTVHGGWRITVPALQPLEIRVDMVAGSTATATFTWGEAHAFALKIS
jgi:hypothetical protein